MRAGHAVTPIYFLSLGDVWVSLCVYERVTVDSIVTAAIDSSHTISKTAHTWEVRLCGSLVCTGGVQMVKFA